MDEEQVVKPIHLTASTGDAPCTTRRLKATTDVETVPKCSSFRYISKKSEKLNNSDHNSNPRNKKLLVHARNRTGEKPYKCEMCQSVFGYKLNLLRHFKKHNRENPYKCVQCNSVFRDENTFFIHALTHADEKRNECDQSQSDFRRKNSFIRRITTLTGGKQSKSGQSKKQSKIKLCSNKKKFKCAQCTSSFTRKSALNEHERTHIVENPFKCTLCDYACNDTNSLFIHVRKHIRIKQFNCEQCNYVCSRKSQLKTHEKKHIKLYTCAQCPYACSSETSLIIHKGSHSRVRPYQSTIDKRLEGHLKRHQATSSCSHPDAEQTLNTTSISIPVVKPYNCNQCDYTCSVKSELTLHQKTHDVEKQYICDQCDYACGIKSELTIHQKKHLVEKQYKCDQCDYACSVKSQLTIHQKTHDDEKLYKCGQIDNDFQQTLKPNAEIMKRPKLPCYAPKDSKPRKTSVYLTNNNSHLQTDILNGSCNVAESSLSERYILPNTDVDTQDSNDIKSEIGEEPSIKVEKTCTENNEQSQTANNTLVEGSQNSPFVKEELNNVFEEHCLLTRETQLVNQDLAISFERIKWETVSSVKLDSEETDISNPGNATDSEHLTYSVLNNIKKEPL